MIEEMTPPQAARLQQQGDAVLLDVRSQMEFSYVGHPLQAVHVALQEPPGWQVAADFVERVAEQIPDKNTTILALCRSGARSMLAAELLTAAGYGRVINIKEGFEGDKDANNQRSTLNGWRFHGLPWEQC